MRSPIRKTYRALVNGTDVDSDPETVLQLEAGSNHPLTIETVEIFFDGATSTNTPVEAELQRQTTAGTGGDANTPTLTDNRESGLTLELSALQLIDGGDPTPGNILYYCRVHPQAGLIKVFDPPIIIPAGERVGLILTAAANVNVDVNITGEE